MVDPVAFFQYINTLPDAAVYWIVNDNTKEVYINYSSKLKDKLGYISEKLQLINGKVEFRAVADVPVYKRIEAEKIRKKYLELGYRVLMQPAPFIRFKIDKRLDTDSIHIMVSLISARGFREIVGLFKSLKEADKFIQEYYFEGWENIVYACNAETRKYWTTRVYKQGLHAGIDGLGAESNEMTQADNVIKL